MGCGPAQSPPRCTNSPPINGQCTITVLLYDGPLLCGFNVAIKGLSGAHVIIRSSHFLAAWRSDVDNR